MAQGARLSTVVIFVHDLDRSVDFYTDILGLEVADRSTTAALLSNAAGTQLVLRAMGAGAGPGARGGGRAVRGLDHGREGRPGPVRAGAAAPRGPRETRSRAGGDRAWRAGIPTTSCWWPPTPARTRFRCITPPASTGGEHRPPPERRLCAGASRLPHRARRLSTVLGLPDGISRLPVRPGRRAHQDRQGARRRLEGNVRRLPAGAVPADRPAVRAVRPGRGLRRVRRREAPGGRDALVPRVPRHRAARGRRGRSAGRADHPRPRQPQERDRAASGSTPTAWRRTRARSATCGRSATRACAAPSCRPAPTPATCWPPRASRTCSRPGSTG